ncbi:uncharacterized protein LOC134835681 [Culicoides brevitarsis]|uniref:uncharacterized protein LOC134835681 n=1 Tax=Culicoides brevitarsis TaxID=469753 RepID=UPI00307C9DD8
MTENQEEINNSSNISEEIDEIEADMSFGSSYDADCDVTSSENTDDSISKDEDDEHWDSYLDDPEIAALIMTRFAGAVQKFRESSKAVHELFLDTWKMENAVGKLSDPKKHKKDPRVFDVYTQIAEAGTNLDALLKEMDFLKLRHAENIKNQVKVAPISKDEKARVKQHLAKLGVELQQIRRSNAKWTHAFEKRYNITAEDLE